MKNTDFIDIIIISFLDQIDNLLFLESKTPALIFIQLQIACASILREHVLGFTWDQLGINLGLICCFRFVC